MSASDFSFGDSSDDLSSFGLSDVSYTGLDDTATSFSGSSTLQGTILGSPLPLSISAPLISVPTTVDSSYAGVTIPTNNLATDSTTGEPLYNGLNSDGSVDTSWIGAGTGVPTAASQAMTGASETGFGNLLTSSPYPGSLPLSGDVNAALSSLGKFGAGFAQLFAGPPTSTVVVAGSAQPNTSGVAAAPVISGQMVIILVIVAGALILLLAKGGE
jgi:hypothetical protein